VEVGGVQRWDPALIATTPNTGQTPWPARRPSILCRPRES